MSDDDGFSVVEGDTPGGKVDFNTCVMIGMITCNKLLARINDVPPGLHQMATDLSDDDLKPNRLNYVSAVDAIEITLTHYIEDDKNASAELKKITESDKTDVVVLAKMKHRVMIKIMARNGLLPLQVM